MNQKLFEISTEKINVKYKGFKNAVIFWALDESHPFKQLIKSSFIIGTEYSNKHIQRELLKILDNQLFRKSSITEGGAVRFLNSIIDCKRQDSRNNMYIINGYVSKLLTELNVVAPLTTILSDKQANRLFKI